MQDITTLIEWDVRIVENSAVQIVATVKLPMRLYGFIQSVKDEDRFALIPLAEVSTARVTQECARIQKAIAAKFATERAALLKLLGGKS